jgi:hypothetical protein
MIDDEKLLSFVTEVDEFIMHACVKENLAPLNVTAIILARLISLNKKFGHAEEMIKLLEEVCSKIESREIDMDEYKVIH